jgi:hypothetical protein
MPNTICNLSSVFQFWAHVKLTKSNVTTAQIVKLDAILNMSQIVDAYLAAYLTVDESLTCMFPNVVFQFLKI